MYRFSPRCELSSQRGAAIGLNTIDSDRVLLFRRRDGIDCLDLLNGSGIMAWYAYVAYFFGGAFLVNAVPHFTSGVMGRRFPSPFSSPPGKGESSPLINVLWGALNVVIGYLLVGRVGEFHLRETTDVLVVGAGGLLMAVMLARSFGQVYSGK